VTAAPGCHPAADVSVIVPVFNSGRDAVRAIRSAQAQLPPPREIIVIDDGSSDDSAATISAAVADSVPPVRLFRTPNGGAARARTAGIARAASAYVAFLDSDDAWLPGKLARQLAVLERRPEVGMVGTRTTMAATVADRRLDALAPELDISVRAQLFKNFFQTSTVVIRRSVQEQAGGFPTGQRHAEEGDLFLRIAARSQCVLLNEVLVDYGRGKGGFGVAGLSADLWAMERGELANIRRAWKRGDCSLAVAAAATIFSLVKFVRRFLIRSLRGRA
jgi:glycosyltransferase involved in cell wall biosynthesis